MNHHPDYSKPIQKSLEVLEESEIKTFPVSLRQICNRYSGMIVEVFTYEKIAVEGNISHQEVIKALGSVHGVSIRQGESRFLIIYNDEKDDATNRYTVAHELGHIFLGHHDELGCDLIKKEEIDATLYKALEKEAWCFARNLLCPAYSTYKLLNRHGFTFSIFKDYHTKWEKTKTTQETKYITSNFSAKYLITRAFFISDVAADTRLELLGEDCKKIKKIIPNPCYDARITHEAGWKCSYCGTERINGAQFCTECGKKSKFSFLRGIKNKHITISRAEDNSILKCPTCGNVHISHDARYCRQCGFPFYNKCKGAGHHLNQPEAKYCFECGTHTLYHDFYDSFGDSIKKMEADMDIKNTVPYDENTCKVKKCPRCGNTDFSKDATFCKSCGLELINSCAPIEVGQEFGETIYAQQHINPPNARYCEHCGKPTIYLEKGILEDWDGKYKEDEISPDDIPF